MGVYDRYLLPRLVDCACRSGSLCRIRRQVVSQARGTVLEVGFGSGANLRHYQPARVRTLLALEPDAALRRLATRPIADSAVPVELIDAGAESIPLDDASVDTVVVTFTLCTIAEVHQAAREMRRVLRPHGRLLFAEHGRAPAPRALRLQQRIEPLWRRLAGGCRLTRDPPEILRGAGLDVAAETGLLNDRAFAIRAAGQLLQGYWGWASRPPGTLERATEAGSLTPP
jgi:SAM-dependent methyltransferase